MRIIPAIDLLDGKCVRLLRGNYAESTEYEYDPVELARRFEAMGIGRIHLVDLNAARGDDHNNRGIIGKIRKAVSATLEVGGGVRSTRDVEELLDVGVDRLIVGTLLVKAPDRVTAWATKHPGTIIAGIDAQDGIVKISGWEEGSSMGDIEAAELAREAGALSIIYTNISRDGTLEGPDIVNSLKMADASGLPLIVSGGIRNDRDFEEIEKVSKRRIAGVITGKALYEGKINLEKLSPRYGTNEFEVW